MKVEGVGLRVYEGLDEALPDPLVASVDTPGLEQNVTHSLDLSGRGFTRAEDARGTPIQSHTSLSILVYENKFGKGVSTLQVYSQVEQSVASFHDLLE